MPYSSLPLVATLALAATTLAAQEPVDGSDHVAPIDPVAQKTTSCEILTGTHSALLTTDTGLVRLIDLESMKAIAETNDHLGAEALFHELEDGRVVTHDSAGLAVLREPGTLDELARCQVRKKTSVLAFDPNGMFLAARFGGNKVAIADFGKAQAKNKDWTCESRVLDLAVSPSGRQVVALQGDGFQCILGGHLSALHPLPRGAAPSLLEFLSEDLIAVGAAGPEPQDPVVVYLVDPASGEIKDALEAPFESAPLGGFVSTLRFDQASGLLSFGISSAGSVLLLDTKDMTFRWTINFGGGNPAPIGISHSKGAARCFSGGMTNLHRAAFSWATGERLSGAELHGYSWLSGSSDDQFTIGISHGRLILLHNERYHPRMRRVEYAAPLAGGIAVFSQPR